jgi:hypothetical protein
MAQKKSEVTGNQGPMTEQSVPHLKDCAYEDGGDGDDGGDSVPRQTNFSQDWWLD